MLVLQRKVDEAIVMDNGIVIRVVKIEGGRVKIGIIAPDHVHVLREEVAPLDWARANQPRKTRKTRKESSE